MGTVAAIVIAYLVAGAHYVFRDLGARVIDQPAYARSGRLGPKLMAMLTWGPVSFAMPWIIGWRWKGLGRYVSSLGLFVVLAAVGIWLAG